MIYPLLFFFRLADDMINVRNVILSLLPRLVATAIRRQCEGCTTNHPSQLEHSCLEVSDDDRLMHLSQALLCCNYKLLSLIYDVNNMKMPKVDLETVKSTHEKEIEKKFLKDEIGTVGSEQMVQNLLDIVGCVFL